jgi:hypothetical protein
MADSRCGGKCRYISLSYLMFMDRRSFSIAGQSSSSSLLAKKKPPLAVDVNDGSYAMFRVRSYRFSRVVCALSR